MHHQHARVYNYDRSTIYGVFREPCVEMTQQFLKMVHYDQGFRLFTYVLTLDGLFRFTETGKEFGIDMLSKHSMHSDVSVYIAWSGEFLVRRLRPRRSRTRTQSSLMTQASSSSSIGPKPKTSSSSSSSSLKKSPKKHSPSSPKGANHNNENAIEEDDDHHHPPKDPSCYELLIDNDSGTYRPNARYLPLLHDFFAANFPGLKIKAMKCDDDRLIKLKQEQRERKKKSGDARMYVQVNASDSSFSSSDEEELDEAVDGAGGVGGAGKGVRNGAGASTRGPKPNMQTDGAVDGENDRAPVSKLEKGLKMVTEPKDVVKEWRQREKGKETAAGGSGSGGAEPTTSTK